MEANAYRFGNIVLFRNIKMPSGFLEGRIESIDKNHIKGVSIFNESAELFSGVWEAKGIPLTEDWLLKMGFKYKQKTTLKDMFLEFNPRMTLVFNDCNFGEMDLYQDAQIISFKHGHVHYVHQLQNLYFALTNTELTINL